MLLESLLQNEGVFNNLINELKRTIDVEKLLCKNEGLLKYTLKKEEKKCEIIKDILTKKGSSIYLKDLPNSVKVNDLNTLMKNNNDLRIHQIEKENKHQIIQIFDQHNAMIINKINSESDEFIDFINNVKNILYAIIPLIEKDQLITQEIYDSIVDTIDKYYKYYLDLNSSQVK